MRRKDNKKSYIYAAICFVIIVLICVIFFVKNVSGNMKVLVAKQDIVKGKIISEGKTSEVFVKEDKIEEAGLELPWLVKLNKNMNLPLFRKEEDLYDYWIENFGDNLKIIAK